MWAKGQENGNIEELSQSVLSTPRRRINPLKPAPGHFGTYHPNLSSLSPCLYRICSSPTLYRAVYSSALPMRTCVPPLDWPAYPAYWLGDGCSGGPDHAVALRCPACSFILPALSLLVPLRSGRVLVAPKSNRVFNYPAGGALIHPTQQRRWFASTTAYMAHPTLARGACLIDSGPSHSVKVTTFFSVYMVLSPGASESPVSIAMSRPSCRAQNPKAHLSGH
ncbi:hypothetical protein C8R47DRAFT_1201767 [Mycena vitilis]|nr:hypothetical protein C8R47DRAFT_1201767 [Mycena vitilis]